jgi:hypothetical protein
MGMESRIGIFVSLRFGLLLWVAMASFALDLQSAAAASPHPGYLEDVAAERRQSSKEIVIAFPPEVITNPVTVQSQIFNERLTKEFQKEYRDRFGSSEFEQLSLVSNRFIEFGSGVSGRLVDFDEHISQQEKFGRYMSKELTEYHLDRYFRDNRATRPVYNVKKAISDVQVPVAGSYKFRFRYKLSSNSMDLSFQKPKEVFHNRLRLEWDGVRAVETAVLMLGYDVSKELAVNIDHTIEKDIYSAGVIRKLTPSLASSLRYQIYKQDFQGTPAQDRVLLGLSWAD